MNNKELEDILQKLATDKSKVEGMKIVNNLAREARFRVKLKRVAVLMSVTLFVGILSFSLWDLNTRTSSIYDQYYVRFDSIVNNPNQDPKISESIDDSLQNIALVQYKHKDYDKARFNLLKSVNGQRNDDYTKFYLAMTYMELQKTDSALLYLQYFNQNPSISIFEIHAKWYIALLYLKQNHPKRAISLLQRLSQSSNPYQKRAAIILKEIE